MTLEEAAVCIRRKRPVMPNDGFLQQLIDFELELHQLKSSSQGDGLMCESEHCKPCDKTSANYPCDTNTCDTESNDKISLAVQKLNVDSEVDPQGDPQDSLIPALTTNKQDTKPLTLENVKEFMSFVVADETHKKSKKKKWQQGSVLYVRKGNISSPAFVNDIDEVYPGICIGNQ